MSVYVLDPLSDDRWQRFVERHPKASIFHSTGWLRTLHRTYGYDPVAFTSSVPGVELQDGLVFCRIRSWLTGHRLVALPFSDHCALLVDSAAQLETLLSFCREESCRERCKYIEFRPKNTGVSPPFETVASYCLHELNLAPGVESLFQQFHHDCIQRKIRRAEREQLSFQEGCSPDLLEAFYRLHTRARRRLGLVPQPIAWFRNLLLELGDQARIRVASHQRQPVASILTMSFNRTTYYKYGCSDGRFNRLGGSVALMWQAIRQACQDGHTSFDMGRSDLDQPGLITFKDRWGACKTMVSYYRWPVSAVSQLPSWKVQLARRVFSTMPQNVAQLSGRMLYRHIG